MKSCSNPPYLEGFECRYNTYFKDLYLLIDVTRAWNQLKSNSLKLGHDNEGEATDLVKARSRWWGQSHCHCPHNPHPQPPRRMIGEPPPWLVGLNCIRCFVWFDLAVGVPSLFVPWELNMSVLQFHDAPPELSLSLFHTQTFSHMPAFDEMYTDKFVSHHHIIHIPLAYEPAGKLCPVFPFFLDPLSHLSSLTCAHPSYISSPC